MNVSVTRSPMRLLAFAALAVPAILLSIDILFAHHWYPKPATNTQVVGSTVDANGSVVDVTTATLTLDGHAQRKRDLAIGSMLLLGGLGVMGWSLKELLDPVVLLRADGEGLSIRVDGMRHPARFISWDQVVEVRSGTLDDDGADLPVLSIKFTDPELVPVDPAGAEADPPWLHLFADEWDVPAHQVAPVLDQISGRRVPEGAAE
jgi:hypothetical protein